MPRLTVEAWADARALYESGEHPRSVAEKMGVSFNAVRTKIKSQSWKVPSEPLIRYRTAEKISGVDGEIDPQKRETAIDNEAERRAAVIRRHRAEWVSPGQFFRAALTEAMEATTFQQRKLAFESLKAAKIAQEALAIRQQGEARAWGVAPLAATRSLTAEASTDVTVHIVRT